MNFPVKCKKCNQPLYGPVKYCPFCGVASIPPQASLTIKTQPIGAAVFLNNDRKGNSPLTINDLVKGSYTVRLEIEGYETKEEQITLGQENQILDIKLEKKKIEPPPARASLTINTQPVGVAIFLNGERKGNSPLTINDLAKGSYTVRLEIEGYETKEEQITLGQESQSFAITLEKMEPKPGPAVANLTINTNPVGASVFLNSERKGISPLSINDLEKGSYTVRLELAGYKPKDEHVALGQEDQILDIKLEKKNIEPPTASLTINTTPAGASIYLNGERKGSSPLTIKDVEKGSHTVKVELDGYKTKEEQITLGQENQILNINLEKMKPRPKYWIAAVVVAVIAILAWAFLKPPVQLASLTINTQPSGASVFLNGDPKGNSPLTITDLKKSSYTVRLELKGYETKEEKVSLDQQSNRIEVMLAVKPPPLALASLTINTQPSGASVFLNGARKGNSPLTISELNKGSYTVRLELEGYETKEEKVSLDQQSNRIEVMLAVKPPPLALASLTINTRPSGAIVYVNGSKKGNSPLTINDLKKGSYTVRLELKGYETKEERISIGVDSKPLEVVLARSPLPPMEKIDREKIDKYLAEGKLLFRQGKYDSCIEIMNKVLQMSKNNSAAQWYITEASKKLEKSRNLSNPSAAGGTRW